MPTHPTVGRLAAANIAVAFFVLGLKYAAYGVTGSAALFSDATESLVNVAASIMAFVAVRLSAKPADARHPFGHQKAEYLSAMLEGALIALAALLILHEAWDAFRNPRELSEPALGLAINGAATAINGAWALVLIRAGRTRKSPALEADGRHLMTDLASSVAVFAGLLLAIATGLPILDPLIAAAVALHILWMGYAIARRSMSGLMDEAAGAEIEAQVRSVIAANGHGALQAHDIRTRQAASALFIEFHLVVPSRMTVAEAHAICDRLEDAIEASIEGAEVMIHVEPEAKAKAANAVDL